MSGHKTLQDLASPKTALPKLDLEDFANPAADLAVSRLGLDEPTSYAILLVGDHSGKLSKGDVTLALMSDFRLNSEQAEAAYQKARSTGVICPKTVASIWTNGLQQEYGELYFFPNKA